jgi:hypothetical protein
MRIVNYLNGISYVENVVEGIDFSLISYIKKEIVLGQNEIYEADFNIAKNDENLVLKTLFYKSIFNAMSFYFKDNSRQISPLGFWTRGETHLIQFPGTENPQLKERCGNLIEGGYVILYVLDTITSGGNINLPNQNFSINLQENSMIIFPSGQDYKYNINKIGENKERKIIEMVIDERI